MHSSCSTKARGRHVAGSVQGSQQNLASELAPHTGRIQDHTPGLPWLEGARRQIAVNMFLRATLQFFGKGQARLMASGPLFTMRG